jgi:hypothetical protein
MVRTGMVAMGLAALTLAGLAGCKKGDESSSEAPKPPPAPIAMSKADPASKSIDFAIQPDGKTSIDMPAPKERIKGETKAAKGELHVDLAKLGMTRGDVLIDLDTFATHTFGDADKDSTQTHHAHTWLQIDDMVKDPAVRERNRWVHFAIRSVDNLSAPDLTAVAPTKEGADDVRTVTLTAHGDLEAHSLPSKAQKDVPLEVRFHVPAGSPPDSKPTLIEVKSKAPFTIVLADHDIKPRDAEGSLALKAFDLLGTKVADVANVSVDVTAKPGG